MIFDHEVITGHTLCQMKVLLFGIFGTPWEPNIGSRNKPTEIEPQQGDILLASKHSEPCYFIPALFFNSETGMVVILPIGFPSL